MNTNAPAFNVSSSAFVPKKKVEEAPAPTTPAQPPAPVVPKEHPLIQKLKDTGLSEEELTKARKILELILQSSTDPAKKIEAFLELKALSVCSAEKAPEHAYWPAQLGREPVLTPLYMKKEYSGG